MSRFATNAIHGLPTEREAYGALRMPIYDSVAFDHENSLDIQLAFEGKKPSHTSANIQKRIKKP